MGPNGTVSVGILPVGNYTVNWTTVVDANHSFVTNRSLIRVDPASSFVNGTDVTVTYGEVVSVPYGSINATQVVYVVFDDNDNIVANGTVGSNGTVSVGILPVGNYTVNWTTVVDANHSFVTNRSLIRVDPASSFVNGTDVTVTYGEVVYVPYDSTNATQVTYQIKDVNGNVVASGTVNPDGTVIVENLSVGNYTVDWTTIVDSNHIPANNISTIDVLPSPTKVTIGNVTTYPGLNVTIPINLTANDKPISGTVEVTMPDNTTITTDVVNGTGTITWNVPSDYTPDRYNDAIKFPGNEQYLPSIGTGIIEVIKIPTHISVGNVTTYPGRNVVVPINVTSDNGLPFNGDVTITLPDGTKSDSENR